MKRFLLSFLGIWLFLPLVSAQNNEIIDNSGTVSEKIKKEIAPVILVDDFLPQGEQILFDASKSDFRGISEGVPAVSWEFGDGTRTQWGKQIIHEFKEPGKYKVKLSIRQGRERESVEKVIFVYSRKGVIITKKDKGTQGLINQAGENGIWLKPIFREILETGVTADEELFGKLQKNQEFIKESELIIFNTSTADAMQNVAQWWNKLSPEENFNPQKKIWVQVLEKGTLKKLKKLFYPSFSILNPREIFIIRYESLALFFEQNPAKIASELKSRGLEYEIIDGQSNTTWFLPISKLTNYFVFRGISQTVLYLLLAVPFIVFIITFARQFVGLKTFGVFSPMMLSLSFMLLGLDFGFTVFAVVLLISLLLRLLFNKVELLYIPKVALLHSGIALSFFLILGIAVYFNISINLALAIFPMLVMSTISEKFISAQSEGGFRSAIITAGETVLVSFIAYLLVMWTWLQTNILATPELIFIPILGNIWLGRFTGLRLTEYLKFRTLFKDESEE
jgi:PKD repeat protein